MILLLWPYSLHPPSPGSNLLLPSVLPQTPAPTPRIRRRAAPAGLTTRTMMAIITITLARSLPRGARQVHGGRGGGPGVPPPAGPGARQPKALQHAGAHGLLRLPRLPRLPRLQRLPHLPRLMGMSRRLDLAATQCAQNRVA